MSDSRLYHKLLRAEELGLRLEIVGGLPIWESHPVYKHQKAVDVIRATIKPTEGSDCACVHAADIYISFPDGSLKRPDISIFRREPDEEEEAVRLVPEAVIEVISRGYEAKDLDIAPRFYLSQGVRDIIIFNPYALEATHIRHEYMARHASPVDIELLCGCRCTA